MFNQDYIMRQVQQLTQVLNTILAQAISLKKLEEQTDTINYIDQELIDELGFDLDEVLSIQDEDQLLSFIKKSGFNSEHLNILADILFEIADQNFDKLEQHSYSLNLFSRSLMMYEFIEETENVYSIDRNLKISKIKDILS